MEFWNLAASGELVFALQDGFSGFVSIAGYIYYNTDTCRKCEQQFSFWQLQLISLSSTALRNYTPNLVHSPH